ncbi:MAG: CDC48 family AAA ATPase [Nitrososphaerota archaeon]|nr:CDC48 family AAA ATPase [Nitrososphaerota archaeon]MDG6929717.1 CDC48 family AAA ATPase [Nitrososphaerota archaeon]MDG6932668.1 CDC48 family AAA ATPase [Nitrososphaerota archaeon]MDG6936126.1 CDC48 family AAA ATPase [Nitrososphaerota archaeon]MDG6944307.1 CDC48 family AAA ATPase [Nitrososphaerota archaeon]
MSEFKLRVVDALPRDTGKYRVRIPDKLIKLMKLKRGDIITIAGKSLTAAYALPHYDKDTETIKMDNITRKNAGTEIGDYVTIKRTGLQEALQIQVELNNPSLKLDKKALEAVFKKNLSGIPVIENNILETKFMGNTITFLITSTNPKGAVKITSKTKILQGHKKRTENGASYQDVGGLKDQLQMLREMVELPLKYPKLFKKVGIEPPRGVLLYGPPGCGKTLLAKALANETDASFYSINGPEIMSKYYGETEAKLREIFKEAKKNAPSIIFIDELDSIAPKRSEAFGEAEVRVVAQLLTLMDGLKDRGDVIVIGATNRVEDVDPALRRPGRFDRELEIGVPNEDGRLEILNIHIRGMPLEHTVDLKKYARMTAGYSGADLAALCREAAFNAIRRITPQTLEEKKLVEEKINTVFVTDSDFINAYRQIVPTALRELYFEIPKISWNDIGGYENLISKLKLNVVEAIENIEKFKKVGIEPPRGVLLYGPPGCGKTLLAKALANEAKANLITIKGPEILSKWVGESEKAVREIFRKAKSSAPSIILLDEVDSITKIRGSNQDSIESIVSQLITAIDSLQPEDLVFIIGTTNRPDLIDPSLLRPGRFDLLVYVGPPNAEERNKILTTFIKKTLVEEKIDINKIVEKTEGYSGADLKSLVREAGLVAISRGSEKIELKDFSESLQRVKPTLTPALLKFYDEINKHIESRFTQSSVYT